MDIGTYEAVAMLRLSDDERIRIAARAEKIFGEFNALDAVETDGVEPLVSVLDEHSVLREDISEKLLTRDEIMANAPEKHDGYFQVPGTLD